MSKLDSVKKIIQNLIESNKKVFILFAVIGLIVYGQSLYNGFVWDDDFAIVNNPQIKQYDVQNVLGPNIFNDGIFYRPMSAVYYFTIYHFFGQNAFIFHLSQLIIHILIATLLFQIFKQFFKNNISFILSVLFLIHPINTETISFICGGQAIIYTIFGLYALYLVTLPQNTIRKNVAITICFCLALLAKEEGLQYILITNLYVFIFNRKLFKQIILMSVFSGLIYVGIRSIFALDGFGIQHNLLTFSQRNIAYNPITILRLSLPQKLLNIPLVSYYYLKTFLIPSKLSVDQIWAATGFNFKIFMLPLLLNLSFFTLIFSVGYKAYKSDKTSFKTFLFFLIWLLIGLGIHMPIWKPFEMTVADRWFYFAEIGILGLCGISYKYIPVKGRGKLIGIICLIVIVLLSLRSHTRSFNFKDNLTLFTHDSLVYDNVLIEQNLSYYYFEKNDIQNALKHSAKSIDFFPTTDNMLYFALELELVGNLKDAGKYYKASYETPNFIVPENILPQQNYFLYSRFLIRDNNFPEAIKVAQEGIKSHPNADELFVTSAVANYILGNKQTALDEMTVAIKLLPTNKRYMETYNDMQNNKKLQNPI